ncbi:MAG: restriction endonuclease, partial [Spirochaetes bacterium GWF1_49_6]
MKVVARYDFNNGKQFVENNYQIELNEIISVISRIDASLYKTKESEEKTMIGKILFSPSELNKAFKREFSALSWVHQKVICNYTNGIFSPDYKPAKASRVKPFRDMDFLKPGKKIGIEVQFGKYSFMVYNVCAKMTIFKNLGFIDAGIEIVPVKNFADEMSTGVSYFEQFAWDLEKRGVSNIDIPVLIL